jgi:hypothetical protein
MSTNRSTKEVKVPRVATHGEAIQRALSQLSRFHIGLGRVPGFEDLQNELEQLGQRYGQPPAGTEQYLSDPSKEDDECKVGGKSKSCQAGSDASLTDQGSDEDFEADASESLESGQLSTKLVASPLSSSKQEASRPASPQGKSGLEGEELGKVAL